MPALITRETADSRSGSVPRPQPGRTGTAHAPHQGPPSARQARSPAGATRGLPGSPRTLTFCSSAEAASGTSADMLLPLQKGHREEIRLPGGQGRPAAAPPQARRPPGSQHVPGLPPKMAAALWRHGVPRRSATPPAAPLPTLTSFSCSATPKHFLSSFKGRGSRLTSHPSAECFLGLVVRKWSRISSPSAPPLFRPNLIPYVPGALLFPPPQTHLVPFSSLPSAVQPHRFSFGLFKVLCCFPSQVSPPVLHLLNPIHLSHPQLCSLPQESTFWAPTSNPPLKCYHISVYNTHCIIRQWSLWLMCPFLLW